MRIVLRGILAIIVLAALSAAYLIWQNNRAAPPPEREEMGAVLEKGIGWLLENRANILKSNNSVLWNMVQQAADASGDKRLQTLFAEYEKRHLDNRQNNIWRPLFYPGSWVPVRFEEIARFPYYNWFFIYAATCDRDLAELPQIAAQNEPDFCDEHPISPACVTHQMMGLMLLRRSQCGDAAQREDTVRTLQQRIVRQLTWDPRVVDVYMQRVLMLVQSGAGDKVKPVWLRQLSDAQQPDGGWSDFMPLIPLGGNRSIGVDSRSLGIGAPNSNFHITAQGVLLFALLTAETEK